MQESWFDKIMLRGQAKIGPVRCYLIAIALAGAATAFRLAFLQALGTRATYITFYPAVVIAALYGGVRAGLFTTVLAALLADYFWIEPTGQFGIKDLADWLGVAVFLASGTMISFVVEAMHRAQTRARLAEARVDARQRADEPLTAVAQEVQFLRTNQLTSERFEAIFSINKAFAVALSMLVIVAWFSLRNAVQILDFDRTETHADDVIHKLDQLLFSIKDTESDARAFLLLGDQNYLNSYQNGSDRLNQELLALKRLIGDNPQQQGWMHEIETALQEKLAVLKQAINLQRSNNIEAVLNKLKENIGHGSMLHIHNQANLLHNDLDRLRQDGVTRRTARNQGLIVTIVAGYFLSLSLLFLVFILLRKQIFKRIQAEASLLAHQEHLEQTVALRTNELELINTALLYENTERKRAEETMRDLSQRLSYHVDNSPMAVIEWGPDMRLSRWSGEAERIFGWQAAEVLGKQREEFRWIYPEDEAQVAETVAGLVDGSLPRNVSYNRNYRKDGSVCYCEWYNSSLVDESGKISSILSLVLDVTIRMRAEEALRVNEFRLHTLANAMPQLAWIAQPDGYIFWYNQRWYDYTGTTPEQMSGWGWQNVHDPEMLPKVLEEWRSSLATGEPFEMEFPLRGADGRFRQFLTRGFPLKDAEGKVVNWFGTNTDVSDRKLAEERIQISLHEKDLLLKEIHHRVKNNLQVISSLVDLQADSIDNPTLAGLFQDVRDRVRSMAMVHETLYRSDNLVSVDFADYASGLMNYLWRAHGASAAKIKLTRDMQPVTLAVETAVPCGLLLNELAVNALKHAFAGRDEGEVVVSIKSDSDGLVRLGVSDNGVGFSKGQDWRQKHSLGLNLVRMLTKQLKGTVEVESNGGTSFLIAFTPPPLRKPTDRLNK
jgi:PAS domain S-box-containing protein